MTQKPWYANGLRFRCTGSGNCCQNHGDHDRVYLAERDVDAIADFLALTRAAFLKRWCHEEDGWTLLRNDGPACSFLDEDRRCTIYPVRPRQCATWPFWEENLVQETWEGPVKDCCAGVGQGPLIPLEEVERLARETEEWFADE
jgi:Fe-S-cluster containining protein